MRWRVRCASSDPRTLDQRRSDALAHSATAPTGWRAQCGNPDCDAAGTQPSAVVVHVITHEDSLSDDTPVQLDGKEPRHPGRAAGDDPARSLTDPATTDRPRQHSTGGADGRRHAARPVVGRQDRRHREVRADRAPRRRPPQPRYIPSAVFARFIRCRDMTCRFPGCDEPAHHCDIDHTIAYPAGPTQASNLKCVCRKHHLLKTFGGWHDQQSPDGTVVWTSPHGQTYTTHPGSRILFPTLCRPTAPVTPCDAPNTSSRPRH